MSYFAKVNRAGVEELVAITGETHDTYRYVLVGPSGHPLSGGGFMPKTLELTPMIQSDNGFLTEDNGEEDEDIDWARYIDTPREGSKDEDTEDVSGLQPSNPALAAYPELQE